MPIADFLVAGLRVRLESDRDSSPFRAFSVDLDAARIEPTGAPDLLISIHPREWGEPSPLHLPRHAELIRFGGRKLFRAGEDRYIDFHENAFFRISGETAEGVCYNDAMLDPMFWTELCLHHVLLTLLERRKRWFLHGGGALLPTGEAILFTGPAGSGKSTAALRLAEAGWPFLGDDMVLLDEAGRVHPYPKRAAAGDWTIEQVNLNRFVTARRGSGKRLLSIPFASGGVPIRRILLPIPSSSGINAATALERDEAGELLRSQMTFDPDHARPEAASLLPLLVERTAQIQIGDLPSLPSFISNLCHSSAG